MNEYADKPYSIVRLHSRDERCWGVVNAKGALVNQNGLSTRLTKSEADALAFKMNGSEDSFLPTSDE